MKTLCQRCFKSPALFILKGEILNLPVCLECGQTATALAKEAPHFEVRLVPLERNGNGDK